MRDDNIDYAALGQRVEEGLRRDKRALRIGMFGVNLFLFVLFMLIAWVVIPSVDGVFYPDAAIGGMLMLMVGWAVGLFLQGMTLMVDTAAGERQMRQQVMTREIQRVFEERALAEMRAADYAQRKAKRSERLGLSDDGELVELGDADMDDSEDDADTELRQAVLREQMKWKG
jgi:hypothetical protein